MLAKEGGWGHGQPCRCLEGGCDSSRCGMEGSPLLRRDLESPQAFISQGRPAPGLPARCPSGQSFCPANTGQKPRPKGHIRHREDLNDGRISTRGAVGQESSPKVALWALPLPGAGFRCRVRRLVHCPLPPAQASLSSLECRHHVGFIFVPFISPSQIELPGPS